MYAQTDVVKQRIHPIHIVLRCCNGNKHLGEPLEIPWECYRAKRSRRPSSGNVLIRILVLVCGACSPRSLVSHEQNGAAISVTCQISVHNETGQTQGCEGECILGPPGCGRVDLQSRGAAVESLALGPGNDDIGRGRNLEIVGPSTRLCCNSETLIEDAY